MGFKGSKTRHALNAKGISNQKVFGSFVAKDPTRPEERNYSLFLDKGEIENLSLGRKVEVSNPEDDIHTLVVPVLSSAVFKHLKDIDIKQYIHSIDSEIAQLQYRIENGSDREGEFKSRINDLKDMKMGLQAELKIRNPPPVQHTRTYPPQMEKKRQANKPLFRELETGYNKCEGVRVGDWIKEPNGDYTRVTHIWRDENENISRVQTGGNKYGRYALGMGFDKTVYNSYSGSLDSGYKTDDFDVVLTKEEREGAVWIWDGGSAGADRGVDYMMDFRVFEVKNKSK